MTSYPAWQPMHQVWTVKRTLRSSGWKIDVELCALTLLDYAQNDAVVVLNNFFAYGKAHAGAFIFRTVMQALEDFKDLVAESRLKADAIVAYRNLVILGLWVNVRTLNGMPLDLPGCNGDSGSHA